MSWAGTKMCASNYFPNPGTLVEPLVDLSRDGRHLGLTVGLLWGRAGPVQPSVSRFLFSGLFILKSEAFPLPVWPTVLSAPHGAGTDALLWRSADIKEHVKQIEKAVSGKEPRFVLRALRALPSTSRRLNTNVVNKTICGFFTNNSTTRDFLLSFLEEVSVGLLVIFGTVGPVAPWADRRCSTLTVAFCGPADGDGRRRRPVSSQDRKSSLGPSAAGGGGLPAAAAGGAPDQQ